MCMSCESDRRSIGNRVPQIRGNAAPIANLRNDRKRAAESYTRMAKSASDCRCAYERS